MRLTTASTGVMFALAGATAYGLNITFARLSAQAGVDGPVLVAYRVVIMLALAAAVLWWRRIPLTIAPDQRGPIAVLGLASAGVGIGYISSVAFIPVTVAAVIFYTFPIVIVLASPLVEGRRLSPALLGIAALAFVGIVCVLGPGFDGLDPRGIALAALASLSAAAQFFAASRSHAVPTAPKIVLVQFVTFPTALLIAALTSGMKPPSVLLNAPLPVALTIAGFLAGFVLHLLALARINAVTAGLVFCLEPVVAAITAAIVLGERLAPLQYVGGGLVIAAIVATVTVGRVPPDAARPASAGASP